MSTSGTCCACAKAEFLGCLLVAHRAGYHTRHSSPYQQVEGRLWLRALFVRGLEIGGLSQGLRLVLVPRPSSRLPGRDAGNVIGSVGQVALWARPVLTPSSSCLHSDVSFALSHCMRFVRSFCCSIPSQQQKQILNCEVGTLEEI